MANWKIRNRLIAAFLALTFLSLTAFGFYALWSFDNYNRNLLSTHLEKQAQTIGALLPGFAARKLTAAEFDAQIKQLGQRADLRITVIDAKGRVLADSNANPAEMDNHADRPEILAALSDGKGQAERFSQTLGENFLYVAIPLKSDIASEALVLRLSSSLSAIESGFNKIRYALLAAYLLTAALVILVGIGFARKITAALESITATAKIIATGRLDVRTHVRTGDEIELLALTLNQLASNLEDKVNEMLAEKHKLELILEHMDNAVILLDQRGRVFDANKVAMNVFDIQKGMFGQHNLTLIGNSSVDRAVREVIASGERKQLELKTPLKNGNRFFQLFLVPISGVTGNQSGVLAVFHDITTLQEIYERQTDFVANASHELATPLTTIKGFAETLLSGAADDPAESRKFIAIIKTEADRMQKLVADLLQLARLNSPECQRHIKNEPVHVRPILETVIQEMSLDCHRKGIGLELCQSDESINIWGDPDWFKQIVVNLVDNAIKYTPSGGKITIESAVSDNRAVFTVADSGIGIPAEDLPRIFERFYRVDRARTRTAGGTGLGLAIVKFIVETMGGSITVKSRQDAGTSFIFTLPVNQNVQ